MSTPNSTILVMNTEHLDAAYEHTLYWPYSNKVDAISAQMAYFQDCCRKTGKTFNNYTYLRAENAIKIAGVVANAEKWNYLAYQNGSGKWYYNFITKVEYLNDSAVKLYIELDVLQTYMHEWELHSCFIERTHTKTDEIGEHTVDEGLDCGELTDAKVVEYKFDDLCIMMMVSDEFMGERSLGNKYNGIYSGLKIYATDASRASDLGELLESYSGGGKIDAIVSMWMYPKELVSIVGEWSSAAIRHEVQGFSPSKYITIPDMGNTANWGRYPRNNKLLTYPFTMLYVSNNMGGAAAFRRERLTKTGDNFKFKLNGALGPDCGVTLTPQGYNGNQNGYEYSLAMPPFPTCAWISDTYKVWLAQNQNSHDAAKTQIMISGLGGAVESSYAAVGSALTQNYAGAAYGAVSMFTGLANTYGAINSLMAMKKDMAVQPDQARGNHSGNINMAMGNCGYTFYFKTVTKEYLNILDDYFDRYGYRVNTFDVPSLRNRKYYTYIKTRGCNVTGPFGSEIKQRIQAIFDKGVTWWSDGIGFGQYINELLEE